MKRFRPLLTVAVAVTLLGLPLIAGSIPIGTITYLSSPNADLFTLRNDTNIEWLNVSLDWRLFTGGVGGLDGQALPGYSALAGSTSQIDYMWGYASGTLSSPTFALNGQEYQAASDGFSTFLYDSAGAYYLSYGSSAQILIQASAVPEPPALLLLLIGLLLLAGTGAALGRNLGRLARRA